MRTRLLILCLTFALSVSARFTSRAGGAITYTLINRGRPIGTSNSLPAPVGITKPGWTATTFRLISDSGNITGVNFTGTRPSGTPRGIYGCFSQIWTSPAGDGNYTESTPGFRTENNATPSEFNLDSHFLGDPSSFVIQSPLIEGNIGFPEFNPIASTPTMGYGSGKSFESTNVLALAGYMRGAYDVVPSQQNTFLDVAYLGLGGGANILCEVHTTNGTFEFIVSFGTGPPFIPEPTTGLTVLAGVAVSLTRVRRRHPAPRGTGVAAASETL